MKKKVLSLTLALVMALALVPTAAFAAEEDGPVIIPLPEEVTGILTESTYPQFYEGLLRVYTGGKYLMDSSNSSLRYGFVDKTGKFVVPMEYEYAYIGFSSGMASVRKDGKEGCVDTTGKMVFECEEGWYLSPFSGNAAPISHRVGENNKCNLIDKTGKLVLSAEYDDISNLSYENEAEGLFKVRTDDENRKSLWGVINDSGKVIVPVEYNRVSLEGTDRIRAQKDGEDSYFDTEGKPATPHDPAEKEIKTVKLQDYDAEYEGTFTDGLAAWRSPDWGWSEAILINEAGKTVIPRGYENGGTKVSPGMYVDGLAILSKETGELNQWGGLISVYGVVDRNGGVVVPFEYDRIYPLTEGEKACAAVKDDKYYIIDFNGMTLPLANPTQTLADLVEEPEIALPETGDAKENVQAVQVDGKDISFAMYSPDNGGTNYVRLVDLAAMLSGTAAQFDVKWNAEKEQVELQAKSAYTAGAPGETPFHGEMTYESVSTPTYVNGEAKELEAIRFEYQNGGYTYYKLRDLGEALGFNVGWDNANERIYIESDKAYDPNN